MWHSYNIGVDQPVSLEDRTGFAAGLGLGGRKGAPGLGGLEGTMGPWS